jgi:ATP-dependent Clp protease ATP-binding subunit ClpC
MFERFTDRARRVVVLGQEQARELGHNYIGTEHLLLGILAEGEGVAVSVLGELDVSLETARQQVLEVIGRGKGQPSGHVPFTPRAKKVLELSLREAKSLGHAYIGTEHILLGLIREGDGVAAQVLVNLGAELKKVRQQVIRLLHVQPGEGARVEAAGPPMPLFGPAGQSIAGRLDAIGEQLAGLTRRLAAIERHLGVPPEPAQPEPGDEGPGEPGSGAAGQ